MGYGMEMDGCGKCARVFMFVANFIIWLGSIVLLVLGVWTVVDKPYLESLLGSNFYANAAYIIIAIGVLAFFVSFLGCFGALKEIKCMLILYFIIVLLMFVVLLVGGILGYVFRGKAQDTLHTTLVQQMKIYDPTSPTKLVTRAWDDTQVALMCCGIDQPGDWVTNAGKYYQSNALRVPRSCCKPGTDGNMQDCERAPASNNAYITGCYAEALSFVEHYGLVIGCVGVVIALLMLLGLIFSIVLFKMIK